MTAIDTPEARGRVGLAWVDITPPVGIYHRMWGAATHDRATGVHRPLRATALWIEPAGDRPRALVALDHCLMDGSEIGRIREAVAAAAGLDAAHVLVTLSHTHGAGLMSRTRASFPGGDLIGPYLDEVARQSGAAARQAREQATSATLVFGAGRCSLAAQRDFFDKVHKHFVCGYNPGAEADDTLLVTRIVADDGRTLGSLVNYACHPTTLAWENTLISPDYVGALRETVEAQTGAPCLFLQGASGDLGPREGYVGDARVADRNGRQLGFCALATLEALPPPGSRFVYRGPVVSGAILGDWRYQPMDTGERTAKQAWRAESWREPLPYRPELPTLEQTRRERTQWEAEQSQAQEKGDAVRVRDCRARVEQMTRQIMRLELLPPGKTYPLAVDVWRWGDSLWVFVPGEHYQSLQSTLRRRFPDRPMMIVTLTGDWQPGYVPPASTYGYGIYQESIAAVAAGSAELLIEAITRRIRGT